MTNKGRFGFERFSSIGPFVERQSPQNYKQWGEKLYNSSGVNKVDKFYPEIEVVLREPQAAQQIQLVPNDRDVILDSIKRHANKVHSGEIMLFHETSTGKDIMSNGFDSRDKFLFIETEDRVNGAFFWVHPTDIGQRYPDQVDEAQRKVVIAKAPIDKCVATTAEGLGYIHNVEGAYALSPKQFDNMFTVTLETYLRSIEGGAKVSREHDKYTLSPYKL